jgi:hypothetical protein
MAGYIHMQTFYDPDAIEKSGTQLNALSAQPSIRPGHSLVAIIDNGITRIAADVTNPNEYRNAQNAFRSGAYFSPTIYEVSTDKLKECPDKGWLISPCRPPLDETAPKAPIPGKTARHGD